MRTSRSTHFGFLHCFLWLLQLLLVLFLAPDSSLASATSCNFTTETQDIITDSYGQLCSIEQLDSSGCCPKQEVGKSEGLLKSLCNGQCCNHYAACVHKCMSDDSARQDVLTVANQNRFRGALVSAMPPFEICRDVCRTHSGSVTNGNSFISDFRFCYGTYIGLPPPPLPSGIKIVAGDQGSSCDDACGNQKMRCSVGAFSSLNTCSLLIKHFNCKYGCSNNFGGDQPAYVAAQSDSHFGKCLINSNPDLFSCSGKHSSTRRLCPCA
jgi:hypothetical protein